MSTERTNLHRVVSQTLQWIHGITSLEYQVHTSRLAKIVNEGETHYSVDIKTNSIRLVNIKHPLGLNVESIHMVMGAVITEFPDGLEFNFEDGKIATVQIADMYQMFLKADNAGYSTVGVQTKIDLFTSGEEILARNFIYRNNLLHQIR